MDKSHMPKETPDDEISLGERQVTLRFEHAEGLRLHFVNHAQVSAGSTGEVQIFFGQSMLPSVGDQQKEIVTKHDIAIAMTFLEFKRLVKLFNRQLPRLQKTFETIESDADKLGG